MDENEKKQPSEARDGQHKSGGRNHYRHGRHRHRPSGGQNSQNNQSSPDKDQQAQKTRADVAQGDPKPSEQNERDGGRPRQSQRPQHHGKRDGEKRTQNPDRDKKPKPSAEPVAEPIDTADAEKQNGRLRNQRKDRPRNQPEPVLKDSLLDTPPEDDFIFGRSSAGMSRKLQTHTFTSEELDEIEKFDDEELFGTSHLIHPTNSAAEDAVEVIAVRFKPTGKAYFFDPVGQRVSVGDNVILETARGPEFGEVVTANRTVEAKNVVQPLRPLIRVATKEDIEHHELNKKKEAEAFNICLQKVANHGLDMKLVEAQYAFDNSKLLFYFTSAGRVDFRELVRDLASVFRTRIELRQIGIRDEAKMLGGIGICGRPLCCSRFLSNFAQVSIKMAKEQGLSLNSGKISGNCGRLMCCLGFESQTYLEEIKRTPMAGSIVKVDGVTGTVTEATPLIGMLKVHLQGAPDGETVTVHRDSVTVLVKKGEESDTDDAKDENTD